MPIKEPPIIEHWLDKEVPDALSFLNRDSQLDRPTSAIAHNSIQPAALA
jgi:hypothetical protein